MFRYTKEVNDCLLKIKQGDKSQFEPLFQMTALHLRGVAKFYLKNRSLADDVVSETFIKIYKYIDSFNGEKGYTWMCKIIQNTAVTYNVEEGKIASTESGFTRTNARGRDDDFNEMDFFEQIAVLSEKDREIAIERFYFGKTFAEIGKRYNVSRVAIFNRVQKICKNIKKNIKNK